MSELYFNIFSIDTARDRWNQTYSSNFEKATNIVKALEYDLLIRNPYNLTVENTKNIILNENASKVERAAAVALVVFAYSYTLMLYSFFIYSIGFSINGIATLTNSKHLTTLAALVDGIAKKTQLLASAPMKFLFYKIPKKIFKTSPVFLNFIIDKVCRVKTFVFDIILIPFFRIVMKVLLWEYLQMILVARIVFDKTSEICDWTFKNILNPFWKNRIGPRIDQLKKTTESFGFSF